MRYILSDDEADIEVFCDSAENAEKYLLLIPFWISLQGKNEQNMNKNKG